jgi:multisubunit Na+/H+ antiporter MnhG subunit
MTVFDLRIPLGCLFVTLGVLLIVAGLSASPDSYTRSLSLNINVIWGAVMTVFGIFCLILAKREARRRKRISARESRSDL